MAQFRLLGTDTRYVYLGTGRQWVEPGDVVDVDDSVVESYACQTELWEPVPGFPASTGPVPTSSPPASS